METLWFLVQKFISTLRNMAFKVLNQQEEFQSNQNNDKDPSLELTKSEIELILKLLSQTSFPVKDIETLYIALWKLQETHKIS